MKLYLVSKTDNQRNDDSVCDDFSFVVAAESEESALEFRPSGDRIECLGISDSSVEKVMLASFNEGYKRTVKK